MAKHSVPLSKIKFSDLYVKDNYYFLKGVPNTDNTPLFNNEVIEITDIDVIRQKILEKCEAAGNRGYFIEHDGFRYRCQTENLTNGRITVMRKPMWPLPPMKKLGYNDYVIDYVTGATKRGGLILIAGSTGSGKTTLACSTIIKSLQKYGDFALCIEDPPELPMAGQYKNEAGQVIGELEQIEVVGGDFATPLSSALRMNPEYLFMGEMRKPNDAYEVMKMAQSGHCIISTVHAEDCAIAVSRMAELVQPITGQTGAYGLLSTSLNLIIHQKMVNQLDADNKRVKIPKNSFLSFEQTGLSNIVAGGKLNELNMHIDIQTKRIISGQSVNTK